MAALEGVRRDALRRLGDDLARGLRAESAIRLAWLFGSRVREAARAESDVDVAVLVDDACADGAQALHDARRRLVPAMTHAVRSDLIDLVILNNAPPLLCHRVIRDGILLYARSDVERVRFMRRTLGEYLDLEPRLREQTRLVVRRMKERRPRHDGRYHDLDIAILSRRLDALEDYVQRLRSLGRATESEYVANPDVHDLAARYLHLAAEAAIDIANHWICDAGLRTPDTNRDVFLVLEQAGEIDRALSDRLQNWASFRNVLVHEYLTIDHAIAYRAIRDGLGSLDALRRWALGKLDADRS